MKVCQKIFYTQVTAIHFTTPCILELVKKLIEACLPSCIWSVLKKNRICKLSYAFTLSHQIFSRGNRGIEACLWLMRCGTSCLQLRWGLQRVLTVFTPNILLQEELIRIDASLSTARRAPHHSLSPLSKSGDCSWMLTLQHGDGL